MSRQRSHKETQKDVSGHSRDKSGIHKMDTDAKKLDETHSQQENALPIPWFVIVAINVLFIVLFIAFVIYCFHRRKKRRQELLKNSVSPVHSPYYTGKKNSNIQSSNESMQLPASSLRPKNSIFTIEENQLKNGKSPAYLNNGERVFEKNSRASFVELNMEKPAETPAPVAPPPSRAFGRFRSISRLTSRLTGGFKYNPVDSAAANNFTRNNAEIFPDKPAVYEPPNQVYPSEAESKSAADLSKDETDEDISDIAETIKHKEETGGAGDRNGDSGFGEQIVTAIAKPKLNKIQGSSEEDTDRSERERLTKLAETPVADVLPTTPPKDGRASAAVQTTPISWLNIPGAIDLSAGEDFHNYLNIESNDRKYFIYLVTDANPYFRKDCIGRISLPLTGKITLSELREHLMKADDENLRRLMKKHSQFRFLTETYRFVAQNEAVAPLDDVYPTNGIFIKINAADLANATQSFAQALNRATAKSQSPVNETMTAANAPTTGRSHGGHGHGHGHGTTNVASRHRNMTIIPSFIHAVQPPSRRPSRTFDAIDAIDEHFDARRDAMNRRHVDCVSPHPIQRKLRIRRKNLLFTELKKYCDNPTCTSSKRSILKCGKCNVTCYCSPDCKRQHWPEHKITCTKPPWRL